MTNDGSGVEGPDIEGADTDESDDEGMHDESPVEGTGADGMVARGPDVDELAPVDTGDARVDAILTRLGDLDEKPVVEHAELYLEVHARLAGELNPVTGPRGAVSHGPA